MSAAAQVFSAVRAAAPTANPFTAIANALFNKFYAGMPAFFMQSINVLHALYAVQTTILLAAIGVRWKRTAGADIWVFRAVSTPRGTFIVPHFALSWQLSTLFFLVLLQPYLVMTKEHARGNDWRWFMGARTMGYLPAWVSTWLALWSLTVAVCLPRASGRSHNRATFLTHPRFINGHFFGGLVLCCVCIMTPSNICSPLYDRASEAHRHARALLLGFAPSFASMTTAEVDTFLAEVEPFVNEMLSNSALFPKWLRISWSMWSVWVLYAYVIFVAVAVQYFGYIKKSMTRVTTGNTQDHGRQLKLAWLFATLTSTVVTLLGVVYFGTSLAVAIWTEEVLASSYFLAVITLISLYGFAILGFCAAVLSLAQSLIGSSSSTNIVSPSLDPSSGTKHRSTRVHVSVHTRTDVDHDLEREKHVVQLELADWQHATEEKGRHDTYAEQSL